MSLGTGWQSDPTRAGHYARNPFTGGTMRLIEFIVWFVRLRLVDFGQRCRDREIQLAVRTTWDHDTRFSRFVDWLSPFSGFEGYKRRSLRRLLYAIRYPIQQQRFWSLALVQLAVFRVVPRPFSGRYQTYPPSIFFMAEWLDGHTEYADYTTGDSDRFLWAALFDEVDVPWSLRPETWLLTVDSHGFVGVEQGEGGVQRFHEIDHEYVYDPENVDEFGGPDDSAPSLNVEGDPTLNGAFSGTQVAQ